MKEKSYYRQGIEQFLLRGGKFKAEDIYALSDEELDKVYHSYLIDNDIDEKAQQEYLSNWFFMNR